MSSETELTRLSATALAARIRNGDVTATEAVEAHLERIDERDGEINAFVTVCAEAARDAAAEADAALEDGADVGPLHGVPLALKDLGALKAGVRHTYGSALFANHVADRTSAIVQRLEDAGAIVIGKTNTPELGHKGTTDNEVIGATASPIDPDLNAGGSSGGSAAALAAGMAPIATGSDAGGSLRIPAAACGVYGFKPTFGLVPDDGRPSAFGRELQHTTKGPMTRTVADAALLLSIMADPHPDDPNSVPVEIDYRDAVERSIDDYRIAYSPDLDVFPVADEVRAVVDDAVTAFADAGATVDEISVDHGYSMAELSEAAMPAYTTSVLESATVMEEAHGVDFRAQSDEVSDSLLAMLHVADDHGPADVARSGIVRTGVYDAVQDVLADYDLLVAPTLSAADVSLHADLEAEAWEWPMTWPFNWTGHPVASAPAGLTERGGPVGLQLVGRRFADDDVLAVSAALERERPWDGLYD
ncbi:amidase [Natrinema pellirubrum DSM 15624]|uniref:Amidase n=1 Tax=Natrinema pellirubrum (strain DSM 15624 / CIP 106293 / JCM 10476 / NCIMB 786 / 157) TaxID=797303 RepID=L0JNM9_NATP1|nr:amidase [Natrinema pellirubrum]AGB31976.1 amidase, Asp-tRNAAsn/Glu-tRNAGln amidotransferase A subunit [Natrinema pellirubrum DSM 15624]ELY78159.1 amidase [Natrinema pellirubrum DSM 15624]